MTGGGLGGSFTDGSDSAATSFVSFNGGVLPSIPSGITPALLVGLSGALLGAAGVYGRFAPESL